jgi:hypothetical protein
MTLKEQVYRHCEERIQTNIALLQKQLQELTASAGNETKRTAGDKHETALAMLQIEQENISRQLKEALLQQVVLRRIDPLLKTTEAVRGSVIQTNKGIFFLSLGLGKITIAEKTIIALSPESPLGNRLLRSKAGDTCTFNDIVYSIEDVA